MRRWLAASCAEASESKINSWKAEENADTGLVLYILCAAIIDERKDGTYHPTIKFWLNGLLTRKVLFNLSRKLAGAWPIFDIKTN